MIQDLDDIDEAVAEYLEYRRFGNTLDCLRSEMRQSRLRRDRMAKCSTEDLMNDPQYDEQAEESRRRSLAKIALMEAFDRGHMMDFLGSWAIVMPKKLLWREAASPLSRDARVTEFLACVHFATLPFRASSLDRAEGPREASVACAKAMTNFRRYLDGRGRALAQDREVVSFYALPHVPDPAAHPAFDFVFRDDWVAELRTRLEDFLQDVEAFFTAEPLLLQLLNRQQNAVDQAGSDDAFTRCLDLAPHAAEAKAMPRDAAFTSLLRGRECVPRGGGENQRYHNGHRCLENVQDGIKEQVIRDSAADRVSSVVRGYRNNFRAGKGGGKGTGALFLVVRLLKQERQEGLPKLNSDRIILAPLDYRAIKNDLRRLAIEASGRTIREQPYHELNGRENEDPLLRLRAKNTRESAALEAALLLQAIRWRFSTAPAGKARSGVLYQLIRHDIFDVRSTADGAARSTGESEIGLPRGPETEPLLKVFLREGARANPLSQTTQVADDAEPTGEASHVTFGSDQEEKQQWRKEYGGEPARLVAEYAMRLLNALVSMSKARAYVLGQ
ncbi:unnamed protein product, partial [Sphacelaria rigidula]